MKEDNTKIYLILSIIGFFIVLYISAYVGALMLNQELNLLEAFIILEKEIMKDPLAVKPLNGEVIFLGTITYFLVMVVTFTNYERNKKTMPGKEYGSAEFLSKSEMKEFRKNFMHEQLFTEGIGGKRDEKVSENKRS